MNLSKEQKIIHDNIMDWWRSLTYRSINKHISCAGFAGTGKTTLLAELRKTIHNENENTSVAFVTFTGKASSVIKEKLNKNNCIYSSDFVGTIHSLIYRPVMGFNNVGKKVIVRWEKTPSLFVNLIIIDEASMVSTEIFSDLDSYGIPIIAFGDHGQLAPVNGETTSIITNPDFILTEIHRQAEGNPIIKLSKYVRDYGKIPTGVFGEGVFKIPINHEKCKELLNNADYMSQDLIVLCGMNRTRVALTKKIRHQLGFTREEPYPGERMICLKNNHNTKIMNGQLGTLVWMTYSEPELLEMTIQLDGFSEVYSGVVCNCFCLENYDSLYDNFREKNYIKILKDKKSPFVNIDFFDFGYAISVHRSQGSEFNKVILFEERSSYWDDDFYRRWLYTAVTRAKEKLFIVGR